MFKKTLQNCKTLHWEHLIGCQGVKFFLPKACIKLHQNLSFWVVQFLVYEFITIWVVGWVLLLFKLSFVAFLVLSQIEFWVLWLLWLLSLLSLPSLLSHMGQKDQDGYVTFFFQLRSLNTPILKQVQTKVKRCNELFCL